MVRVVYNAPAYARVGIVIVVFSWAALFAYLVSFTNPPLVVIFLLFVPFLAVAWTLSAVSRETVWETDDTGLRKHYGRRVAVAVEWNDVGRLIAKGTPRSPNVLLLLVGRDGRTKVKLLSGAGLDVQGLRVIYQSACQYLRVHGVKGENTLGWPNMLPLVGTQQTRSARPNWSAHAVGLAVLTAGISEIVRGILQASPITLWLGAAISVVGTTVVFGTILRSGKPAARVRSPPPFG